MTLVPLRFCKDAKWDELAQMIVKHKSLGAVFFAGAARDWLELRQRQAIASPLCFAGDDGDAALERQPAGGIAPPAARGRPRWVAVACRSVTHARGRIAADA